MTGTQIFAVTLATLLSGMCGSKTFHAEELSLMQRHSPLQQRVCPEFDKNPKLEVVQLRRKQGPVHAPARNISQKQVYLFVLVAPYTGSTAVSGLLATSPKLATLCAAETQFCEGQWILSDKCNLFTYEDRWLVDKPKDWNEALKCYSKYWNLSQPVLMDKSPSSIGKAAKIYSDLQREDKEAKFLMVTRSPCYNAVAMIDEQSSKDILDDLLESKRKLPPQALLHLTYEDLVHDPYAFAEKILDFLPQLETIDPSINGLTMNNSTRSMSVVDYILGHGTSFRNKLAGRAVPEAWLPFMKEFGYLEPL